MIHTVNDMILEGHYDDALDMSTEALAGALNLPIDALGTKSFADCVFDGDPNHKILYTGYEILSHDELATQYANKCFEEGPDGPC